MADPAGRGPALGLDTNVLLRYLLADDARQHAAAAALIDDVLTPAAPGLVHPVVLCEAVWALRQVYKVPKADVVRALARVLGAPTLRVLDAARVREALHLYESHAADFADALLSVSYRAEGAGLVTFDQAAQAFPGASAVDTADAE